MKWVVGGETLERGGEGPCSLAWRKGALRQRVGQGAVCHKQAPERRELELGVRVVETGQRGRRMLRSVALSFPISRRVGDHLTVAALGREGTALPPRP